MGLTDKSDQGFSRFYQELFPLVIKISFKITGSMEAAEDICQEAFVRFYNHMDDMKDDNHAKYWIIRVVKNLSFNFEKRKGRERKVFEKLKRQPSKEVENGEKKLLKQESIDTVQKMLSKLLYKYRVVIVLKEYAHMNYKEIGGILGISEGNVKIRVFRAREQLSKLLKEDETYVP
ncbi:MAG: RNA polymerase sigma factor [Spirochaetia bacterium]